jgi:hypothetical protein
VDIFTQSNKLKKYKILIQREGNFLEHETPKADVKIVLTENKTAFLGWGRNSMWVLPLPTASFKLPY